MAKTSYIIIRISTKKSFKGGLTVLTAEELRRLKDKGPYEELFQAQSYSMYDHLPYKRDINLCGPDNITLVSGNIIKYYRYKLTDTYTIDSLDISSENI